MPKVIQNVNILDLSSASADTLQEVTLIQNVNAIVYGPMTAKYLSHVTLRNINTSIELPEGAELLPVNGELSIENGLAAGFRRLCVFLVNGRVVVHPDVTVDTIEQAVEALHVNGQILCPERLEGIIRHRTRTHNGTLATYMDGADLLMQDLNVDDLFLRTLKPRTNLVVTGRLTMIDALDISLWDERIGRLDCLGDILLRESLVQPVSEKLQHPHQPKIHIIPTRAQYIGGAFNLDADNIEQFEQAEVFVEGDVHISDDVTAVQLDQAITRLHANQSIVCRKELKKTVLTKCVNPTPKILDYVGKLQVIGGEHRLTRAQLQYSEGGLSFLNRGVLSIAPNVNPKDLLEKVGVIHNFGVIEGDEDQCAVIYAKLGRNEGVVTGVGDDDMNDGEQVGEPSAEWVDAARIENVNILKL